MDTVLLSAILTGVAVFFGLMALFPSPSTDEPRVGAQIRAWQSRRVAEAAEVLAQARLELSPRTLIALSVVGPFVLGDPRRRRGLLRPHDALPGAIDRRAACR